MEYDGKRIRHEQKYFINKNVYDTLRLRLPYVTERDANMKNEDGYLISSLYFDDMYGSAWEQKKAGIRFRKKFRLRCYDRQDSYIRLECKQKYDAYIAKSGAVISRQDYDRILGGDYAFLAERKEEVCHQLFAYHMTRRLKPVVNVEYLREAYVLPQGNVRITFDKEISASVGDFDMFSERFATCRMLPEDICVLEVKFDDFIPNHVLSILKTAMTDHCAVSKYVMCREGKRRMKAL